MEDMNKKDFRNKLVIAAGTLFCCSLRMADCRAEIIGKRHN